MTDAGRMFEPPAADLAVLNARVARLPSHLADCVRCAGDALGTGDLRTAQEQLARALQASPRQPDVLRLYGLLLARLGNLRAAIANFEAAIRAAPDDAVGYSQYAQVLDDAGDAAAASRVRDHAALRLPHSPLAWADLGASLVRGGRSAEALAALQRSVGLAPDYAPAQLDLGDALLAAGCVADGVAAIRRALALEPAYADAWLSLADIKTAPISIGDMEIMRSLLRGTGIAESERTKLGFALGKACEDHGQYHEAHTLFTEANRRRKLEVGAWDATAFLSQASQVEAAFSAPHAVAEDPELGAPAIFVVGMPRSGTTLVEQILASHPRVQGLGERGELARVLAEESARRQQQFPQWVPVATAGDWCRLGRRYLDLLAPEVSDGAHFVDKLPNNWQALGAIRAMLPAAHIVVCRRDALENCWSCFKQYFARGWEFTCDPQQLGVFWQAFDRAASAWAARAPARVREQSYEALGDDPQVQICALLDFCGLPFDAACLHAHESRRTVRTLSVAQVREPLHRARAVARGYGTLLDPLRRALGRSAGPAPPIAAGS